MNLVTTAPLAEGTSLAEMAAFLRFMVSRHPVLRSPTEVARALEYVRDNAIKHFGRVTVDYSSASYPALVISPRTWLLRAAPS